jgi:hypothetical protein
MSGYALGELCVTVRVRAQGPLVRSRSSTMLWDSAREFTVPLSASVEEAAISAAPHLLDMQHCLEGRLYRSTLLLHNGSRAAVKVTARVFLTHGA